MKVGISLLGHELRLEQLLDLAVAVERAGADSVWFSEYFRNAYVVAALVAARTHRARIGTAIALAFTRSPLTTALAALDIDEVSSERFILGLGPQVRRGIEHWHGLEYGDKPATRMVECVEAIRTAMRTHLPDPQRYKGEYYDIDLSGFSRHPAPAREVPVYLAAVQPGMIRAAVRVGDGLIGHIFWSDRFLADVVTPLLAEAKPGFERAATVLCAVHDDVDQARADAKRTLAYYASTRTYYQMLAAAGFGDDADACRAAARSGDLAAMERAVSDSMLDTYAVAGRPDELAARISARGDHLDLSILIPAYYGTPSQRIVEQYHAALDALPRPEA